MIMKRILLLTIAFLAVVSCSREGGSDTPGGEPYFSVSKDLKVQFAPGNLGYDKSTGYIFVSTIEQGTLFCWGTGDRPLFRSDDVDFNEFKTFVDWGDYVAVEPGGWRTPKSDELGYIFDYRKNCSKLKAGATVCGRYGALLLPDNWKAPKGIKVKPYNGDKTRFSDNVFDNDSWAKMAAAGAVFLPYYEATEKNRYGDDFYKPLGEYHTCSNYVYGGYEYNYTAAFAAVGNIELGNGANLLWYNKQRSRCDRAAVRLVRNLE